MARAFSLDWLAHYHTWVYAAGLAAIFGSQLAAPSPNVRLGVASLSLGGMVVTYAAEQMHTSEGSLQHPTLFLFGGVGITGGLALSLAGRLAGLLFLAGGLWFLNQSFTNAGERRD